MKHRSKGYMLCILGILCNLVGIILGAVNLNQLFLPTSGEIISALAIPIIFVVVGIVLITLGKALPKIEAKAAGVKAKLVADGYSTQAYSYKTAYEAIEARIAAWESTPWEETLQQENIETLRKINKGVQDLGKMASWFHTSLSGPLYDAARDAVVCIDAAKLKFLSGFISYCSSVTEFELKGDYFRTVCVNAQKEVTGALELYASMRSKLNSYSGDPNDILRLKAEMEQITGLL